MSDYGEMCPCVAVNLFPHQIVGAMKWDACATNWGLSSRSLERWEEPATYQGEAFQLQVYFLHNPL